MGQNLMSQSLAPNISEIPLSPAECVCWSLWYMPQKSPHQLQNDIEKVFSGYRFYPEAEWAAYGRRPPEDLPLLGAWRHASLSAFAFLLDAGGPGRGLKSRQAYIYLIAHTDEVARCEKGIRSLKDEIARLERRALRGEAAAKQLTSSDYKHPIRNAVATGSIFTVLVNLLWLYLARFTPDNSFARAMVSIVEGAALLTLALFSAVCFGVVLVSGLVLLRRMLDARNR
jgi:hypothetical protein